LKKLNPMSMHTQLGEEDQAFPTFEATPNPVGVVTASKDDLTGLDPAAPSFQPATPVRWTGEANGARA